MTLMTAKTVKVLKKKSFLLRLDDIYYILSLMIIFRPLKVKYCYFLQ